MSEVEKNEHSGEPENAQANWQGVTKSRIYLWIGGGLVALYFIGQGVWGLIFGEADPDPSGHPTTSISVTQAS